MTARIVQPGTGTSRDIVVLYHLTAELDGVVRAALSPAPLLINVTEVPFKGRYRTVGVNGLQAMEALYGFAASKVPNLATARLAIIGFSEGCQAVRAHLIAGVRPDVVMVIDGTHGSWPHLNEDFEVRPYREAFARAAAGEGRFIASHSGLAYVEKLPQPYASTRTVLQAITGWPLETTPATEPAITREGGAVVYSYAKPDHVFQCKVALPRLLREELAWQGTPTAVPAPPPALPLDGSTVLQLAPTKIPATVPEVAQALVNAWTLTFGARPAKKESIALLLAQWALETGRGKSMWNFNLGNIKSRDGDGRCFTYFGCNEVLPWVTARNLVSAAKARTDGKPGPNAVITSAITAANAVVWFYPSHPACRFRAYRTLDEGTVDYLALLYRRFTKAWPFVISGEPVPYVAALKAQGYFTAALSQYTSTTVALFNEFMALDIDLEELDPGVPTADGMSDDERQRVCALVTQTMLEGIRGDIFASFHREDPDDTVDPSSA